jgi:spoIIIJ-associated protein
MPETSEAAARLEDLMHRFVDVFDVDATVEVSEDDDGILGRFEGEDLGRLIGHHGQALDAIQHVAYRIAYKGLDDRGRLTIDASGYRERRAAALQAAADQAAEAAIRDGRPVPLESMSALERKVVHEHLKDRHDVETYSEGQEPNRRLVVAPLVER